MALSLFVASGVVGLRAAAAETITLAAEDDWAPYSSSSGHGAGAQGFAVDIVREALGSQGIKVRFEVVPFARCMFLAERGVVSGCFDATIVDDNRDAFHWHRTPMFEEELAIFALSSTAAPAPPLGLAELAGKAVGYTIGYTYPTQFRNDPHIRRVGVKSDRVLLEMLMAGRVDYVLLNTAPGYLRINSNPSMNGRIRKVGTISCDGFWVAFSKAVPDGARLADAFEKGLGELKASGRYAAMDATFRQAVGNIGTRHDSPETTPIPQASCR